MVDEPMSGRSVVKDNFSENAQIRQQRLQGQVSEFWLKIRGDNMCPSLSAFQGPEIKSFRPFSFLLDVRNPEAPAFLYVGEAYTKRDGGRPEKGAPLSMLGDTSFLGKVSKLYRAAYNAKSTFAFEGDHQEISGNKVLYRGIVCPLSENQEFVQYIYGVVNWKTDSPSNRSVTSQQGEGMPALLAHCQNHALNLGKVSGRSRETLYEILSDCMNLYLATKEHPEAYKQMLSRAGLKAQKRAPFTPVLKLVFGVEYDKTRITEYAAALSYAVKHDVGASGLSNFLRDVPGGIKGCVKAERRAKKSRTRRREPINHSEAEKLLRTQAPASAVELNHEFDLALVRRGMDGKAEYISVPGVARSTVKAAMLRAAKKISK